MDWLRVPIQWHSTLTLLVEEIDENYHSWVSQVITCEENYLIAASVLTADVFSALAFQVQLMRFIFLIVKTSFLLRACVI